MSVRKMKGRYTIFMFLDIAPGKTRMVAEKLMKHDEIIEVHLISGQYDLLAVLDLDLHGKPVFTTVQELAEKSIEKIRKLEYVRDTNTIVPFSSLTKRVEGKRT